MSAPCYATRFRIIENHCGFAVIDDRVRALAGFGAARRIHIGASDYYPTRQEAIEVAVWLTDRAAGYPYDMLMAEWPRSLKFSDMEGATWDARTCRADAYDWTRGSAGMHDGDWPASAVAEHRAANPELYERKPPKRATRHD